MNVILYAEDHADDVFFMMRACKHAGITETVHTVPNGARAVAYLSGSGEFADRTQYPMPQLVLLDLKMPEMSGFDVLRWIRGTPSVAQLPVFILTSSNHDSDIQWSIALGAHGYLTKTGKIDDLARMIKELRDRYLNDAASAPR